jgi:hypothetical protein
MHCSLKVCLWPSTCHGLHLPPQGGHGSPLAALASALAPPATVFLHGTHHIVHAHLLPTLRQMPLNIYTYFLSLGVEIWTLWAWTLLIAVGWVISDRLSVCALTQNMLKMYLIQEGMKGVRKCTHAPYMKKWSPSAHLSTCVRGYIRPFIGNSYTWSFRINVVSISRWKKNGTWRNLKALLKPTEQISCRVKMWNQIWAHLFLNLVTH